MYKYVDDKLVFEYTQESEVVKNSCYCLGSYTYNNVTYHLTHGHVLHGHFQCVCGYWSKLTEISEVYYLCPICARYFYLGKDWTKELPFGPYD